MTLLVVNVTVVPQIPCIHVLVQAIKPVGRCRQIGYSRTWDITWDEGWDWVTDEHIGLFDVLPEELPNVCLRSAFHYRKVCSDLDVTAIEDRAMGSDVLDERDETRHLRIIDHNDICTAFLGWTKRAPYPKGQNVVDSLAQKLDAHRTKFDARVLRRVIFEGKKY